MQHSLHRWKASVPICIITIAHQKLFPQTLSGVYTQSLQDDDNLHRHQPLLANFLILSFSDD